MFFSMSLLFRPPNYLIVKMQKSYAVLLYFLYWANCLTAYYPTINEIAEEKKMKEAREGDKWMKESSVQKLLASQLLSGKPTFIEEESSGVACSPRQSLTATQFHYS